MTCPLDSVLADDAGQMSCSGKVCLKHDEPVCCQRRAICNSMTCPSGYSLKYNSALYLCAGSQCHITDRDTCCDAAAYCSQFTCPATGVNGALGWVKKPDAANIPCGGDPCIEWDTGICCNKKGFCGSMSCPVGFYKKDGAEQIPCEGSGMHACTIQDDLSKCCSPAASCTQSYVCAAGYHFKIDAKFIHCPGPVCEPRDRELCCDMVDPFQAATAITLRPANGEGTCKIMESATSFSCQATGRTLSLTVEYQFASPVGNKVYMDEHLISGSRATVTIPPIKVTLSGKNMRVNVDSLVAGRGNVESRLTIFVTPDDAMKAKLKKEAAAKEEAAAAKEAAKIAADKAKSKAEAAAAAKAAKAKAAKAKGSSSDKGSSGKSKSTGSSSSSSGKAKSKGSSSPSPSGTEQHALRLLNHRRLDEAETSSASLSETIHIRAIATITV